ncbi:cysteine synthase A [Stackebrandtia endophytica]|uniref:Cysteine synthase A n=1 Tax=Stackebrandtia endophytica TaxID=1496996 RepID=A0A543B0X0_9ACTN|nr:PLP-dependent cysteine synthase family protein [Stackebrandtia endophytica]TQL78468.1 cysteine synthase A [Stackebrandtia endophytica]
MSIVHINPALNRPLPGSSCRSPVELVGNTPVLWVSEPFASGERGFWAKLEGNNPGGIKDRAALHVVAEARRRGELAPDAPIIESTSGTFGLGLALAGTQFGHPVTVVTDPGLEPMMRSMLAAYGATVIVVPEPHPIGGWQQARRDTVTELLARHPGSWCPDQYHNPDIAGGYADLGAELVAQLGTVDILVCAVGTGGHSAGAFAELNRRCPTARLVGVDSVGSTIFGQPAATRLMRGLGSSIHPRNVDYPAFSEVHWVTPDLAVTACRRLARHRYTTGGWSVGAVCVVAGWLARTSPIGTRIAAVFCDGPARYADTVFNDDYCYTNNLIGQSMPDEPEYVTEPHEVTRWSRTTRITDPMSVEGSLTA